MNDLLPFIPIIIFSSVLTVAGFFFAARERREPEHERKDRDRDRYRHQQRHEWNTDNGDGEADGPGDQERHKEDLSSKAHEARANRSGHRGAAATSHRGARHDEHHGHYHREQRDARKRAGENDPAAKFTELEGGNPAEVAPRPVAE